VGECVCFEEGIIGTYRGHTLCSLDNHEIVLQHEAMARLSLIVVPGYPFHVTERGVRSMNLFREEFDKQPRSSRRADGRNPSFTFDAECRFSLYLVPKRQRITDSCASISFVVLSKGR
jgi:hypothetical protein